MIHLEFFDSHVAVHAQPALGDQIKVLWPAFVRPSDELPDDAPVLDATGTCNARSLGAFAIEANAFALTACRDLAVHAGVVDLGGVTLALPGTSGAGKSTLTAACVQAGMGYVSDEALCLPYETSSVRAYPRPIALSLWSMKALGLDELAASSKLNSTLEIPDAAALPDVTEFIVAPSALGKTCLTPGPLRHVVVPRRSSERAAALAPLHRADVVALMLKLSFNHFRRPADAFELMTETVRTADVWELSYSDPAEAALLLTDRFG
jgi:hypothetical protein